MLHSPQRARRGYRAVVHRWEPYGQVYPGDGHTVVGDVRVLPGVSGRGITPRDLLVYLPPSYVHAPDRRYPVLYLQDGQNVFDDATAFAGEWGADEAAQALALYGLEAILVALPNGGLLRVDEYSPWPIRKLPSGRSTLADAYRDFLLATVKPCVDNSFRTSLSRARTGIAGSSLGALISLYSCFSRPGVFGFCGAFSPALWPGRGAIIPFVQEHRDPGLRVYLDAGARESGPQFLTGVRRLRDTLRARSHDVAYVEDPVGAHDEASWRRRFPAALAWFLDPALRPEETSRPDSNRQS